MDASWALRILLAALCICALALLGWGSWGLEVGLVLWIFWVVTFAWRWPLAG